MRLEDVMVFLPSGEFRRGSVEFADTITDVLTDGAVSGGSDLYLIPGLVEIHSHGALNCDHSNGSAEEMRKMAGFYAQNGVTSFLATTMTYREEQLLRAMRTVRGYERGKGARCVGVNMEGPFLSREKRGAHMEEMLNGPDVGMFCRLMDASGGAIRLVSVAPELPGAMAFIREASESCKVALAHTAADYDTSMRAFESGATQVTHLFNAMQPFLHRAPGLIGAAMDAGAYVEVISDGIHLHPAVVRAAHRMFGGHMCLISDSIRSAGLPDGTYESGGMPVVVKEGRATLLDGTIAGSNISLMDGLRYAVSFGVPLERAVYAATRANALAIGMEREIGRVARGAYADLVLLDKNLEIRRIFINGEEYDGKEINS